jgi:hypothetical protein
MIILIANSYYGPKIIQVRYGIIREIKYLYI